MKLYAAYIKEAANMELEYTDEYFFTYKIKENEIYLQDVFIKEEFRNNGLIDIILNKVYSIAKEKNKKLVSTSICKNIKKENKQRSTHIITKRGYIEYESDNYMIYYYKEIE